MHYFIDGYNLLFRLYKSEKSFPEKRQKIIQDLNEMIHEVGIEATLVFDAYYRLGNGGQRSHYHHLEIQYTSEKVTADEFIIEALKHSPDCAKEMVVTSDKKLALLARRKHAKTESVEEFMAMLKKRYKNKIDPEKQALLLKKRSKKQQPEPTPPPPSENSIDLYLNQFETRLKELTPPKKVEDVETPPKHKRKIKEVQTEPILDEHSEMERWLRLFEDKNSN